jgi:hypothetical protein
MGGYYNNIMKYNPFLCLYQLTIVVAKVVKCLVGKAKQPNLKVVVLVRVSNPRFNIKNECYVEYNICRDTSEILQVVGIIFMVSLSAVNFFFYWRIFWRDWIRMKLKLREQFWEPGVVDNADGALRQ